MTNERSRGEFRGYEKKDAKRPGLRIAAHIPPNKVDHGLQLPVCERVVEVVRESCGKEISGGTGTKHDP